MNPPRTDIFDDPTVEEFKVRKIIRATPTPRPVSATEHLKKTTKTSPFDRRGSPSSVASTGLVQSLQTQQSRSRKPQRDGYDEMFSSGTGGVTQRTLARSVGHFADSFGPLATGAGPVETGLEKDVAAVQMSDVAGDLRQVCAGDSVFVGVCECVSECL